jgi:hypothetical protein
MQKEPGEESADVSQRGHFDMISPISNGSSLNAINPLDIGDFNQAKFYSRGQSGVIRTISGAGSLKLRMQRFGALDQR